ncbi:Asp-tRNA(Asn)/Glu-tRNA(Gln) amidotransferase A subunit family amidase [Rhodobium orientis]|uniref:Indoleacetamide hydrolase n=1 Tax=Rhodobium orientis TaxID=34017 RepID=A0A327JHU3_9HYPH|nr:amidase [Rhodobium orientis]MBB4303233.1 Asp-tRNA(Asn)/Glu-tRNA(Gln) amidotransferase A subunit family amidase [Rhodobium orientis]MBK5951666.1 amidase [Rhodobium orientis]RAI25859.1 amidase [Rhodobium orientis]
MIRQTAPCDLGAIEARDRIRSGALSAFELADSCIARVEAVDPAVNALVARDFDTFRERAREADARQAAGLPLGPLHGLPFAVKDMIDVAGLPTTYGSEIFRTNIATADDPIVTALRQAGALPIGKTNTPEWSAGANSRNRVWGTTANPYDLSLNCGGSSGGSAVALACGFAPLATGSDTGGSLRTPAAFNGVVGFRPSPGVVPGHSRSIATLSITTAGPMARSVADCGLMLSVMAVADRYDPFTTVTDGGTPWKSQSFADLPRTDLTRLRFAVTEDFGFAPTEGATRATFRSVMSDLAPFLPKIDERHPDCTGADRIFAVLRALLFLGAHDRYVLEQPEHVGRNVTDNVIEARGYSAADVAEAMYAQSAYYRLWQDFFETCDYLISPTVTAAPRDWHENAPLEIDGHKLDSYYHWLALAYASTIAGHPAISIPCGRYPNGLPFGLQIIGRRHDDLGVLAVAAQLESLIAGVSTLAPEAPDLKGLMAAPPLSSCHGFLEVE